MPTETTTDIKAEDYARKIDGLLKKAESTGSPEEAEALTAKAQELMTKYAIDEAMLAAAAGDKAKAVQTIVQDHIDYTGSYARAHFNIGNSIATANECRTLIEKEPYDPETGRSLGKYACRLTIIGFEEDVKRVKLLNTSLQIQAQGALNKWWRALPDTGWMMAMERYKDRRQFLTSFGIGLNIKLVSAADAARRLAEKERGDKDSVALVLRDKKSRVDEWVDQAYGKLRKSVSREYGGKGAASQAGTRAGMSADVGTGANNVGGVSRGELGS